MSTNNGAAITTYDSTPTMLVSPEVAEAAIRKLQDFIKNQMKEGTDYGIIPGTGKKPTLLKPGAEKLCSIYGYAICVDVIDKTFDLENGFICYEVKATLRSKDTGAIVAEGVGCCNSQEKKYLNVRPADSANTVLKMAKKRGLIDATLSATRSSGLFTQDVEDMEPDDTAPHAQASNGNARPAGNAPKCPKCGGDMWDNRRKKASGEISAKSPDFKCKDKQNCDGVIWPPRDNANDTPPQGTRRASHQEDRSGPPSDEEWDNAQPVRSVAQAFADDGYGPNDEEQFGN